MFCVDCDTENEVRVYSLCPRCARRRTLTRCRSHEIAFRSRHGDAVIAGILDQADSR